MLHLSVDEYLHVSEVEVFDEFGVNVARKGSASMSSIYFDPNPHHSDPNEALDGIVGQENYFHTGKESSGASWVVDLGVLVDVRSVLIYNRVGDSNIQSRLSNSLLSLIDQNGQVFDSRGIGNTAGVSLLMFNFSPILSISTSFSLTSLARKVKVQLNGANALHLSEVVVYDQSLVNNVALNKHAVMSSVLANNPTYHPDPNEAIDGIVGVWPQENFFHTNDEFGAWWEVDLGGLADVRQVVIYNRDYPDDSSIAGRLSNSVLSLINGEGDVYDSRNIDDTTGVNILTFNFSPPSPSPTQPPTVRICSFLATTVMSTSNLPHLRPLFSYFTALRVCLRECWILPRLQRRIL